MATKKVGENKEISPREAWEIIRELTLIVSRYGYYSGWPEELAKTHLDQLKAHQDLLASIKEKVKNFKEKQESHTAKIVASGAHGKLASIYKRVSSGELSVEDSAQEILAQLKPLFRKAYNSDDSILNDKLLKSHLVKTKEQITVRTPKNEEGNISITGPSAVADQALANLIGESYRSTHDIRNGPALKMIPHNYKNDVNPIPGVTDFPYPELANLLRHSFGLSEDKIRNVMLSVGADPIFWKAAVITSQKDSVQEV
jgi:hypothetical protein